MPPIVLGEIWQLADPENIGFLAQDRFGVACRLIAHAQHRAKSGAPKVEPEDVNRTAPQPPSFRGHTLPDGLAQALRNQPAASSPAPASPAPNRADSAANTGAPAAGAANLTDISPADKANYARIFASAGGTPTSLLDGDKAREIWVKSELPFDVLGQIWSLADTHARGQLDLTDFTIGMHLLHLVLDGKLPRNIEGLPKVLDPALYKAAMSSLPPPPPAAAAAAGRGSSSSPVPGQPPQQQQQRSSQAQQGGGANWAISPAEKQESDQWFDQIDSNRKGLLEGEQAVTFFGQSGLGIEVLAKVW